MSKAFQSEQRVWQYIKAAGKGRFMRRAMLGGFVIAVVALLGLALLDRSPSYHTSVIMLSAFLLSGYVTAHRLWQNLEKRFSEDRLPPWE